MPSQDFFLLAIIANLRREDGICGGDNIGKDREGELLRYAVRGMERLGLGLGFGLGSATFICCEGGGRQ